MDTLSSCRRQTIARSKRALALIWRSNEKGHTEGLVAEQNKNAKATLPIALEAMDACIETHAIDPDRIYVTGQSMGGAGTYNAMYYRPDVFAAAIPVCGIQDPKDTDTIMKMAIWAFNGKVGWRTQGNHPWKEPSYRSSGDHCSGASYASRATWDWLFQEKRTK